MSSSGEGETPISYAFVTGDNGREGRSHAIRAHWRQRRQRLELQRRQREEQGQRPLRAILSAPSNSSSNEENLRSSLSPEAGLPFRPAFDGGVAADNVRGLPMSANESPPPILEGIPAQVLSGMNLALGSSRLDPFDRFPIQLTSKHHKLLHHWVSTFAGMMFSLQTSTFNPMRDVWFPLDLSNAASFNAIMAHSAAHLSRMQGFSISEEAMQFKIEAVGIVTSWANDPIMALSDDIIAAILRLLSFERYWGSEEEWRIHHNGLLLIIEARGGITTLQTNWRLEISTFLVTLMTKPSWFDSSNQLRIISQQPTDSHPVLGHLGNLHKTRCLWLLSFMQDMRTFMGHAPEIYNHGLVNYEFIRDALLLVKSDLYIHGETSRLQDSVYESERKRLACLFYICVMLQISGSQGYADGSENHSIGSFNARLGTDHVQWQGSVENLFQCLFDGAMASQTPPSQLCYALDLTDILCSMSSEARHGVENCMLQMLCQAATNARTSLDYNWTLDSLLACIEGH